MNVLTSITVLGFLIFFHEMGHFLAAILQGIYVDGFSIGFGPSIIQKKFRDITYSFRAFPLGGFVSFPDEELNNIDPKDPNLLKNRPIIQRVIVISAGVFANLILAYSILIINVTTVGIPFDPEPGILVLATQPEKAASIAGLEPGDGNETSGAYKLAIQNRKRPSALCLSRQGMPNQENTSIDKVALGGYVVSDSEGTPDVIFIGTGSELNLCIEASKEISSLGKKIRVVSMPCVELFEEQEESYKESVLPSSVKKRVVVEAAHSFGWHKYTGFDGICITMDRLGASDPGGECMKNFGFTVENVVNKTKEIL